MTELEKAKKKYWYDHNFDKCTNHWDAHVELSIFAEGWKQALEWVLTHKKPIKYNDYKFGYIKTDVIEKELNGKTTKRTGSSNDAGS